MPMFSYQVPVKTRQLPLVMWHGHGQFGENLGKTPRMAAKDLKSPLLCSSVSDLPHRPTTARPGGPEQLLIAHLSATPDEQLSVGMPNQELLVRCRREIE